MSARVRVVALLTIGATLVAAAIVRQDARLPESAPPAVHQAGIAKLRELVARVDTSDFGQHERGATLTAKLVTLIDADRVRFSAVLGGPRAQMHSRLLRRSLLYVRVLQPAETIWLHQLPHQLAEAAYHEAVHFVKGGPGWASFEEECDAFLAGLQAEAVILERPIPEQPTIDGVTVAAFVSQAYPRAPRRPRYRPVGKDRDWLRHQAGMERDEQSSYRGTMP